MTDTPKILRDMTDAEIGALVRANNDGRTIEKFVCGHWGEVYSNSPLWLPNAAYRIAPPKFLPLEAGKVYRTANCDRECIFVRDGRAWLIHGNGTGYTWNAETGESFCLGDEHQIIGLSENQEAGQ